jgi:hypothetical protein
MHNMLAIIYSIYLIFFSTCTTALFLPQFRFTPHTPSNPAHTNKCTFTLWHKQLHTPATKTNYIRLNELQDHTNGITIDVAALRHADGYSLISEKQVFAIEGLPDNTNLTIRGEDGSDVVGCEHDGVRFTSDKEGNGKDAWCDIGAWNTEVGSGVGSRVSCCSRQSEYDKVLIATQERSLQCAFPCARIDKDYSGELR